METHLSEQAVRMQKLEAYYQSGKNPYPAKSQRSHLMQQVHDRFSDLENVSITVAGRVRFWRDHGKLSFVKVEDASGSIQLVLSAEELGDKFSDRNLYDVGDIIQATGTTFLTKMGEQSLLVTEFTMLTKALRPLPDKWHGLQDEEARYRERYVDMIMRPELRAMFVQKSKFWNAMRTFLIEEGFLEVETPVLESTPGGADAQPFVTHHNALDIDLYLRISVGELWQKRLMVAGFEKTFELGRIFRNEGISPEHLQDYTSLEFYFAYADYNDTMKLVERLYKHCIMETFGTLQFTIHGFEINFNQSWPQLDYTQAVKDKTGIDIHQASDAEIIAKCRELHLKIDEGNVGRGRLIDTLWKYCRKSIAGPVFLINHPVEVSPLAKRSVNNPDTVERYQVIIAGSELGNGYSELNDPIDQESRFQEQAKMREAGDSEAQMHDQDFVEALKIGMPPTSGFGVSERLFSFLMDKPIRECVMFPLLRPRQNRDADHDLHDKIDSHDLNTLLDASLQQFDPGITVNDAKAWMLSEIKDLNLQRHMLATGALMQRLAQHFKAANPEIWYVAGVLHDIDWEQTAQNPDQHSLIGADLLTAKQIHPLIVAAVREHNARHNLPPLTIMSKCLQSLEQLTGLVLAATYVRPDKDINEVKASSLKKKFKDKAFAKGVDRANIMASEQLTGLTLDEAIALCLEAMQGIKNELNIQ